jgi:spore maturation protein CgeB
MKILYVYGKTKERDYVQALRKLGYTVEEYFDRQSDHCANDEEIGQMIACIKENAITHLLSIHMLPNLSVAAYRMGIKYIAMLWDAPVLAMNTIFGKLDNLWVTSYDKLDCERFKRYGVKHVLYQPLTVDRDALCKWNMSGRLQGNYFNEISFVGRLYEKNLYDAQITNIPANMQDYFTSIMEEVAFRWDGANRIFGTVDKQILDYIKLVSRGFRINNPYDEADERFFEVYYLFQKIANIERVCCLNLLAEQYDLTFYTDSDIEEGLLRPEVKRMPAVEPGKALSLVYAGSKINLNISMRGMEGGTPLRIHEIMGAGGFVLSSFSKETAELFEEDKEIAMFRTPEELLEKAEYYLTHEHERREIALAGQRKVLHRFTHEKKLKELFKWVEGE